MVQKPDLRLVKVVKRGGRGTDFVEGTAELQVTSRSGLVRTSTSLYILYFSIIWDDQHRNFNINDRDCMFTLIFDSLHVMISNIFINVLFFSSFLDTQVSLAPTHVSW